MAYLNFFDELSRRATIAAVKKDVRSTSNQMFREGEKALKDSSTASYLESQKKLDDYIKNNGEPKTHEEKMAAAEFVKNLEKDSQDNYFNTVKMASDQISQTEKEIRSGLASNPNLGLSENEVNGIMGEAWGSEGDMHAGILDVFQQTANARAEALNITRFRGTDGGMGMLNSMRSLLYKDNEHFSGKAELAMWSAAGAGVLGAANYAGSPDNWK